MNQIIMFGLNNIVYRVMECGFNLRDVLNFFLIGIMPGNPKKRAYQSLDFTKLCLMLSDSVPFVSTQYTFDAPFRGRQQGSLDVWLPVSSQVITSLKNHKLRVCL